MSPRRAVLALPVGALAVALILVSAPAYDVGFARDCDNLAGECLRLRQANALGAIWAVCLSAAAACARVAAVLALQIPVRVRHATVLAAALVLVVAIVTVDAVSRLDNRYTGWLSDD